MSNLRGGAILVDTELRNSTSTLADMVCMITIVGVDIYTYCLKEGLLFISKEIKACLSVNRGARWQVDGCSLAL